MISKVIKTYIFFVLFFLAGSYPVYAQTYKFELKTFDACGVYEAVCTLKKGICESTLSFPFGKEGKYASIDANISISNKELSIDFESQGQQFSTASAGWKNFSQKIEFFLEPQVVKLYFPNPAITGGGDTSLILASNAFVTALLIDVRAIPEKSD